MHLENQTCRVYREKEYERMVRTKKNDVFWNSIISILNGMHSDAQSVPLSLWHTNSNSDANEKQIYLLVYYVYACMQACFEWDFHTCQGDTTGNVFEVMQRSLL